MQHMSQMWPSPVSVNKVLLELSPFICVLPLEVFMPQSQNCLGVTETLWLTKLKILVFQLLANISASLPKILANSCPKGKN